MTTDVYRLSDLGRVQKGGCGKKAERLGNLLSAGFPVPEGFCIPVNAYFEHVNSETTKELLKSSRYVDVRKHIQRKEFNGNLLDDILTNYRALNSHQPGPVAVRSSSTAEDLAGHSFAGLYETILDVVDETKLLDAVHTCWASYWSDAAISYRDRIGLDHKKYGMAILVQTMIPAKYSGVLFTHSPSDQDLSLVEFVDGNGALLMDGNKVPGRYLIERDTGELQEASTKYSLPGEVLDQLVSMGIAIAEKFGEPQDIEWCLDNEDRVWILQARPITIPLTMHVIHESSISTGMERVYDEPFSVLGCDLAIRRHKAWVAAINRFHHTCFSSNAVTDNVFVYRTTPWRSSSWFWDLWMKFNKVLRLLQADCIRREYDQDILPDYVRILTELRERNLTELSDRDLMSGLNLAVDAYLDYQTSSYAMGEVAILVASILERLAKSIPGEHLDLLTGLNSITIERDEALYALGEKLSRLLSLEVLERFRYSDLVQEPGLQAFLAELQKFQELYGYAWADRYPRDPAWQVNSEALMVSLRHATTSVQQGVGLPHEQRDRERSRNIEKATMRLAHFPVRRFLMHTLLRRAERLFPYKEDRNHFVYQGVMVIQKYVRAIGLRLQSHGILSSSEDIFFLTWAEVQEINSHSPRSDLVKKVGVRKIEYISNVRRDPYEQMNITAGKFSTDMLIGYPCSAGIGNGLARLVRGPGDLQRIHSGEVMICRHFRPAWSIVFARLAGAVIEEGGALSHGATLAREYGIPAVINVPGALQSIQDGSRIVVDGTRGLVFLNDAEPETENV